MWETILEERKKPGEKIWSYFASVEGEYKT